MFRDIIKSALHKPPEATISMRRGSTSARFTTEETMETRLQKFANELFVRSTKYVTFFLSSTEQF